MGQVVGYDGKRQSAHDGLSHRCTSEGSNVLPMKLKFHLVQDFGDCLEEALAVALSPCGRFVVLGGRKEVCLVKVRTKDVKWRFQGCRNVQSLLFARDGGQVYVGCEQLLVLDVQDGSVQTVHKTGRIASLQYLGDREIAACGRSKFLVFREESSLMLLDEWDDPKGNVDDIGALGCCGNVLATARHDRLWVWKGANRLRSVKMFGIGACNPTSVVFNGRGNSVFVACDNGLCRLSLSSKKADLFEIDTLSLVGRYSDDTIFSVDKSGTVHIFNGDGHILATLQTRPPVEKEFRLHGGRQMISICEKKDLVLINTCLFEIPRR